MAGRPVRGAKGGGLRPACITNSKRAGRNDRLYAASFFRIKPFNPIHALALDFGTYFWL